MTEARARVLMALLAAAGLAVLAQPPALAQYPPVAPTCAVDRSVVRSGDRLAVTGDHWSANRPVRVAGGVPPRVLATARTDDRGRFRAAARLTGRPGALRVTVQGTTAGGAPTTCVATVRVGPPAVPNVPRSPLGRIIRFAPAIAAKSSPPMVLLLLVVLAFLAVQDRIDRRDPKLALAPVAAPSFEEFR